ncbi:2-succinyl-5-enolpyruvyl-6-hydroxy-3-cyclohexene-1-carboxylate synthase [Gelidibacter algens]|uniref:2-succinyl-5-enolpyruvyl-6-hydroxy-3-cyclohexene-1-carboxylate synthase n=1 Tax=Gelidibacter algens TaxID=49280 RepID=A0A1A7QY06_9FLAO|nr:2-succinyl-5-enolpyruvyl-6-hydroxy-3-cyclohexene-1-carboxylate synthase [Gelidibacter algens]OBX24900.1 2-succinyl-5-enolpyruvyl-6-hydroxy-3-cyclohexene-1-carboxylate synthase [Gelidibacter algens]RAJ27570.1 2-succinyl-5-enolpyruvyl-6-hydroxy-3-cyclohexene-1-carboxylate synthase [Gelidibacter algens]
MKYPKIPLAQTVIQLCKAKNIKHIVISPGSRNAPLTIGFTNDPFFKCYSIVDERCAAFFALGIAQQIEAPVLVSCTSGSALLNYYPAVAEAFYSEIPLILLSADRPKHLQNIGDGQTINQKNVFENHILHSANLKLDLKDELNIPVTEDIPIFKNIEDKLERLLGLQKDIQKYNEQELNDAINKAVVKKGPVHINVPFDEPLYEMVDALKVAPINVPIELEEPKMDTYILDQCLNDWRKSKRKMILVGEYAPNKIEQKWLNLLAKDESVIVLTETTSNLDHGSFITSIDKLIAPLQKEDFVKLQPEILITLGGLLVSKKIKAFLREYQPKEHWHISETRAYDTFFCLTHHIKETPDYFLSEFLPKAEQVKSSYKNYWTGIKLERAKKHLSYVEKLPFSDFKVFDTLFKTLPNDSILQVGNSSAIRYAQLFDIHKSIEVFCNRGTSGIDGSTSTAIGCAVAHKRQTNFITGDLSFFYDSNALWNNYIPNSFRIIIINNGGGGIFRILPGHKNTENFDTYFETKHELTAQHLAEMYNFKYKKVSSQNDLTNALNSFFKESNHPKILEINTAGQPNDAILLDYFKFLK